MPRISRDDRLERDLTSQLQALLDDPATPAYVRQKAMGTLATLLRRRDKRQDTKAAAARARKAVKGPTYYHVLPDNGR